MTERRIEQLELITRRLMLRARKKVIGLITPYPISNAVFGEKVEGTILCYMFPCEGKITKGMIALGTKPKKYATVNIKIFNEQGMNIKGFTVDKRVMSVTPDLPIKSGDCLEISLTTSPEDVVKEVWVSFLWVPTINNVEAKSFLIQELENDLLDQQSMIEEQPLP